MVRIEVEIRQYRNARKKGNAPIWNNSENYDFSWFMYDLATEVKKQLASITTQSLILSSKCDGSPVCLYHIF